MTTPNYSDAERELRRVEEIESAKMQDRTRAIVEAAERLEQHLHEVAESRTVGRNAKLADVVYAVEHGGALDGALARENVRQLLLALALPASQPVPESKLRAVYEAAERLVARNAEGGSLVEAWEALEAALALPAEPAPAPASNPRAIVEAADRIRAWIHKDRIEVADTSRNPSSLWDCCLEYDRVRALAAEPAPAWTMKPPREPGWYWCRPRRERTGSRVELGFFDPMQAGGELHVVGEGHPLPLAEVPNVEFWPDPVEEPPSA